MIMLMSCPNITNGMNYYLRTKSVSLKYNKRERLVLYGKQLSSFALLMRVRGTYQGWLEPVVNIDKILLLYSVAIFLGCLCDIKLNRIVILTVYPSIGNMSQHWSKYCAEFQWQSTLFEEARLSKVRTHAHLNARGDWNTVHHFLAKTIHFHLSWWSYSPSNVLSP